MPITNSGSPTTPPVTPMTQPNQLQGNLYPFSAFSADNPNLVSAPMLTLKSPWRFSAPGVVSPLSAAPSANVIYTLPLTYPATHKIYIPAAYLVASSGGPYTLTIKTATGTSVVYVPIIKSGDTLLSGNLLFDVYVDASGNVTSDAWEISASGTYGNYAQKNNGEMTCRWNPSTIYATSGTSPLYAKAVLISYPVVFYDMPETVPLCYYSSGGNCWSGFSESPTNGSINIVTYSYGSAQQFTFGYIANGRWRA